MIIILINITPSFESLIQAYLLEKLQLSFKDISVIHTCANTFFLLALFIYQRYLKHINPQTLYTITNFFLWIVNISFLLVIFGQVQKLFSNMKLFCIFFQGIDSLIAELNFLPLMSVWYKLCPDNLEATSISVFTGLINFSNNVSNYMGSLVLWFTDVSQKNIEQIYIPIIIQNVYLMSVITMVLFIEFPTKESLENSN